MTATRDPGPTTGRGRAVWSWGVVSVALAATLVMYRRLWADPLHSTLGSADHTNDPMQMMWFLKWVPWQVLHGRNPFTTDAIFYPYGVSLVWNTSTPTLGLLAAPITLTAGAALSFAVLMTLAPTFTALTGFWWLGRHTEHPSPAAAGGLLLAFNPYMSGHLLGHLNLVFAGLLPIILMLVEDLLWRHPRSQRRTAVYLGLVTAAQIGISEELVLIAAVGVLLALVLALCVLPRPTGSALRQAWKGLLLAVGVFLAAASPLLVWQLFLSPTVTVDTNRFRAVVGDYLVASSRQLIGSAGSHRSFLTAAEGGAYLGWVLIAVLVIGSSYTAWHDRLVRIAIGTLLVLVLFTFGTNGIVRIWLPWRLLVRLPALESVIPARFAFASFLVIAWLGVHWGDELLTVMRTSKRNGSGPRRALAIAGVAALSVSLLTLVPNEVGTYPLPAAAPFFGSAQERALFAPGTPVLLLPSGDGVSMYYQQTADFRFRQAGGYALLPPGSPAARGASRTLDLLSSAVLSPATPSPNAKSLAEGRTALCELGLLAILVPDAIPGVARFLDLAGALTGRPADLAGGGVSVWLLQPPAPC